MKVGQEVELHELFKTDVLGQFQKIEFFQAKIPTKMSDFFLDLSISKMAADHHFLSSVNVRTFCNSE